MSLDVWAFRLVVVAFVGWFASQMATRFRLLQAAPGAFSFDQFGTRLDRFFSEVVFQSRVIQARPIVGVARLFEGGVEGGDEVVRQIAGAAERDGGLGAAL